MQLNHIFTIVVLVGHSRSSCFYIITGKKNIAILIRKLQGTRLSKLCQNFIGIGSSGNINIDTILSFLIYLRLCGIALSLHLKLIHRVTHLLGGRILFHGLIGDGHTTVQVQSQLNVFCIQVTQNAKSYGQQEDSYKP